MYLYNHDKLGKNNDIDLKAVWWAVMIEQSLKQLRGLQLGAF